MPPNTLLLFALLGVGFLIAGGFACRYLIRGFRTGRIARVCLAAEFCAVLAGIALGCMFSICTSQSTPTIIIHGFPFAEGYDRLIDGRWEDFVGPITFPAMAGNFLFGVLVPQIALATVVRVNLKKHNKSPDNSPTPTQPPAQIG